ncbi:MAG: DUF2784 domain-containing protein [Pseudomonadota bacterium]
MTDSALIVLAADLVLFLHVSFVGFVVFGLLLVVFGKLCSWSWIRNPVFRSLHLAAIVVVAAQAWFGVVCPLTTLEMALRERGGDATYSGAFIAHWLESILYYQAPNWVFAVCYTLFGVLVAVSWFWVRPRGFSKREETP